MGDAARSVLARLKNKAKDAYFNGRFEDAQRYLNQAKSRWAVTNEIADEEIVMLRKLMKLSNDSNIRAAYSEKFFDFVINYHKRLFDELIKEQLMIAEDSLSLAMLYDSPLLVIIDELDRHPEREEELLERLKAHSQLFFKLATIKR